MARRPTRQQVVKTLPPSLAATVGEALPGLCQLQITADILGPYATGVRRLSGAFPSGQIQVPEVPTFLKELSREHPPQGPYTKADFENNFAFRRALRLPPGLLCHDIITQRALAGLSSRVRRVQAAHLLSSMSPLRIVSFLPEDRTPPELADMNVTLVDSTNGTSGTIELIPTVRNGKGEIRGLGNEYELYFDADQNSGNVAELERLWAEAGKVALGAEDSTRILRAMAGV